MLTHGQRPPGKHWRPLVSMIRVLHLIAAATVFIKNSRNRKWADFVGCLAVSHVTHIVTEDSITLDVSVLSDN